MKKILLATDGSESAGKAYDAVKRMLTAFPESELLVLHVIPIMTFPIDTTVPQTVSEMEQALSEELEQDVLDEFSGWHRRVKYRAVHGYPAVTITEVAQQENTDLIVVGSHGKGAVDRMFLGSVSHGVLNRAKVPVLIVK